jgi:hypothetical protein
MRRNEVCYRSAAEIPRASSEVRFYPQKRTWIGTVVVSALCQKQTFRRFFISSPYPAPHGIGE